MPTRKQRRRGAKQKRHEYEFVYVDDDGNEVELPADELEAETRKERDERRNGKADVAKTSAAKGKTQARGGRQGRVPQPPSWERAGRRSLILGAVVFVLFYASGKGSNRILGAIELAAIYTALFIPFTYAIDRFAYKRHQARQQSSGGNERRPPRKKR